MTIITPNGPLNGALVAAARVVPHQVARVKPTKTQLKVLGVIKAGESVTASQIAGRCDLSSSFASTLLKGLFEKCYLRRESSSLKTGGVEFNYSMLD